MAEPKLPKMKLRESDKLTSGWGGTGLHIVPTTVFKAPVGFEKVVSLENIVNPPNASGKYFNGHNAVVKRAEFTASSANIDSGAIYIPANSIITRLSVVVEEVLTASTGTPTYGVTFGTSAGDDTVTGTDADKLATAAATVVAKKGVSTDAALNTLLGGATALTFETGEFIQASAIELHGRVAISSGALTSGVVNFIVEFTYLGGN